MVSCKKTELTEQLPDGNQLVVNGLITDGNGPFDLTITRTVPYLSSDSQRTVSNAQVVVIDNFGDTLDYIEDSPGAYKSADPLFSGNVGSTYKLRITLDDSTVYESSDVIMRAMGTLELDCSNCSDQDDFDKRISGEINGLEGVKNIYRWKLYKNNKLLSKPEDIVLIEPNSTDGGLFYYEIKHRTFSLGDTIRVEQLSLTEEMFDFLRIVVEQSNGQTASSPVLPTNSVGNIINVNNREEEVLGFFGASSSESKEIIISSGNL